MSQDASLLQSNQQVEQHLHLAGQLAIRYSRRTGYDQDDLRQVGLIGLIKASRLYEPLANVPFEVYAKPHIRGEIPLSARWSRFGPTSQRCGGGRPPSVAASK